MFVDIYVIQTVPPSNINRDDTGSPKTAVYGGVRRARVSSQAWKRVMRKGFRKYLPEESLGVRTKLAAELLSGKISKKRPDLAEEAPELAQAVLTALGVKVKGSKRAGADEGKMETGYLIYISQGELDALADIAISWADSGEGWKKPDKAMKGQVKSAFHGAAAVDIALFGRMLADVPELNTDACAQVAHAISVDGVTQEYDYFTAVDDCVSDDNAGAGMIGTVDFNSSTLYRYATVNVDALFGQLREVGVTAKAVSAFVRAFACTMPTGMQNTFANRTLPECVLVSFREDQPINAVAAFERPVQPRERISISEQAEERLAQKIEALQSAYDMPAEAAWYVMAGGSGLAALDKVANRTDMCGLATGISDAVTSYLRVGE
ncbi:MAG: type I-E CRISPR-associated protein Cas7/Cse4/CasC [Acidobacteriota bacterium]|nr:type I-E CRISPR-associated protein Cas7/Cse4/CasC [Acidobacteriota bacterium]